jgi:hypothetical protein
MRAEGLEPPRSFEHEHLKLACIPIPPRPRAEAGHPGFEPGIADFGGRCLSQFGQCPSTPIVTAGLAWPGAFRPVAWRTCVRMKSSVEQTKLRRCSRCGGLKPLEDFAWHRKAKRQRNHYCRPCQSIYGKAHYAANRERYLALEAKRKRTRAEKRMSYLLEYFESHPCVDCGESDPLVLEFDHVRGQKEFDVGSELPDRNWESILEEIEKCEVVCSNCHRRRTARRLGTVRAILVHGID